MVFQRFIVRLDGTGDGDGRRNRLERIVAILADPPPALLLVAAPCGSVCGKITRAEEQQGVTKRVYKREHILIFSSRTNRRYFVPSVGRRERE